MATIINNPSDTGGSSWSASLVLGGIVLFAVIALLVIFGLPAIRGINTTSKSVPVINVPEKIDVNVNTQK